MKLLSLIFVSGLLGNLQIANAFPSSDMHMEKRAVNIPPLMASDGVDMKVYAYAAENEAGLRDQLKVISSSTPGSTEFTIDKDFPGLKAFESTMDAPTKKNMIILATPKGSDKVVGWYDFGMGKHFTKADFDDPFAMISTDKDALLGLQWVQDDYRGIAEGKGLLGNARGTPYNVNMAISEAAMQIMEKDGANRLVTLFATPEGVKSGTNQGFKMDGDAKSAVGELDLTTRPTWESKVETLKAKVEANGKKGC